MKVKTTNAFRKNNVPLAETVIVYGEGEVIEVSEERFLSLGTKNNAFSEVFVVPYVEEKKEKVVEVAKKEEKKETAVKKTRKKTK